MLRSNFEKRKIVGIESAETKVLEGLREDLRESIFIVLRHMSDPNGIKIDLVFLVQRATLHPKLQHGLASFSRRNL